MLIDQLLQTPNTKEILRSIQTLYTTRSGAQNFRTQGYLKQLFHQNIYFHVLSISYLRNLQDGRSNQSSPHRRRKRNFLPLIQAMFRARIETSELTNSSFVLAGWPVPYVGVLRKICLYVSIQYSHKGHEQEH
jgi:hypothetical protein